MPWGAEQDKALKALTHLLTSLPMLALLDWEDACQLHTDANELGAGAAVT